MSFLRSGLLGLAVVTAALPPLGFLSSQATEANMTSATRLESAFPFVVTLQKVRVALEAHGFTIFAIIDQKQAAKVVGLNMPATTLLIYGNPKGGTPLMLAAPDFGLELPLKLLFRETSEGRTLVVYNPASTLDGKYGLPIGLAARLGAAEPLIATAVGARPAPSK